MGAPQISDEILKETLKVWKRHNCNVSSASRDYGIARTTFQHRIEEAARRLPKEYMDAKSNLNRSWVYPQFASLDVHDGVVLIGSDLHAWPGDMPIAWQAFVKINKRLKPNVIILNGDIIDGARVSRHGSMLGQNAPKITKEIEHAKKLLSMLSGRAKRYWTLGNHDIRVDNYLANSAPEVGEEYVGFLKDRFPDWEFVWAVQLGGEKTSVEVRHRFRNGIHAAWNNSLHSGVTIVTGHTHQMQKMAVRDRNGTRWGVESGMLGDPNSEAFQYHEGAPSRAHQGFVVLTFQDGILMPPEFCEMINGRPVFRGEYVF